MKKKIMYILFTFIFISSMSFSSYLVIKSVNIKSNNLNYKKINIEKSNWAGDALQYFMYQKTNHDKKKVKDKIDNILKQDIFNKYPLDDFQKTKFEYSFISNLMMPTFYGSTSPEEFFAEAFSRYVFDYYNKPPTKRNITWSILDDFFVNIFPKIKDLNLGLILVKEYSEDFMKVKNIIDDYLDKNNENKFEFDEQPDSKDRITNKDLGYRSDVKFIEKSYLNAIFNNIVGNIKEIDIKELLNKNDEHLYNILKNPDFNKNILKRAPTLKIDIQSKFGSFEELDEYYKNISKFNLGFSSSIKFEEAMPGLRLEFFSDSSRKEEDIFSKINKNIEFIKKILIQTFNMMFSISDEKIDKIFANFIISPDDSIIKGAPEVLGFTTTTNNGLKNESSFIVVKSQAIYLFNDKKDWNETSEIDQKMQFSSENKVNTIMHEFGHLLSSFLSQDKNAKKFSSFFYSNNQQSNLYKGKVFVKYQIKWFFWFSLVGSTVLLSVTVYIVSRKFIFKKTKKDKK